MKLIQILMDKPVYLDLSIMEISKIVLDNFLLDYVKPRSWEKVTYVYYIDTDSLYLKEK